MAENLTLARPYAEAAFQLARAGNALGPWSEALGRMAAVADNGTMRDCIGNPNLTADQLVKLFVDVVGGALTAEQQNFVRVLVDNERLQVLPEIRDLFEQLRHAFEGVKDAEITSAFPLDDAAFARLIADLEQKFGKLQASVVVDPALIGGVRIAIGDRVIDASVRGKLAAMATALQN